ncbi:hypothetical protein MTO96_050902 [Rhipicephalus appendiculatus]
MPRLSLQHNAATCHRGSEHLNEPRFQAKQRLRLAVSATRPPLQNVRMRPPSPWRLLEGVAQRTKQITHDNRGAALFPLKVALVLFTVIKQTSQIHCQFAFTVQLCRAHD